MTEYKTELTYPTEHIDVTIETEDEPGMISLHLWQREAGTGMAVDMPLAVLREMVIAADAASSRTGRASEIPDLAHGGVTAAAVEAEAGVCCGPQDETVTFWHGQWHRAVVRTEKAEQERDGAARQLVHRTRERDDANVRADQAEHALADVHERDETVARLEAQLVKTEKDLAKVRQERNRWRNEAELAEGHDCTRDAAVTDETVERAWAAFYDAPGGENDMHSMRLALRAALTPEPQRPKGAEELEAALTDYALEHGGLRGQVDDMADFLTERGVRAPDLDGHLPGCEGGPGRMCNDCGFYAAGDSEAS